MHLLVARGVAKAHADRAVLRSADVTVGPGDRVGLVGPNGCGKSTLLRILGGESESDGGTVEVRGRVAMLHQEPRLKGETVGEAVRVALAWHDELLARWRTATDAGDDRAMADLQGQLDLVGWDLEHEVDAMLGRLDAPGREARIATLSGGERRRAALARVLLSKPDLLLLDEPTNHLDVATIDRLQEDLLSFSGAVVLVTHDRYLLEAVATRIVEVEDGETVAYEGTYADFLVARAERQATLRRAEDSRLAMIAREAEWASRSPAARSTKQRARLDRLDALRSERKLPREPSLSLDLSTGLKQGQTVLEARKLSITFGERTLFSELDLSLLRGERIGVIGPNGTGKSTLLQVLAGERESDTGSLYHAPRVRAAHVDQHRSGLDPKDTVYDAAGEGNDHVTIGDKSVHVRGFLGRFLFPRPLHDQKVTTLSGGERARLLLARTMLKGCNLLLLDEPTNDLDLLTLRVLEEALLSFDGTVVVITHDRAFLDRVCTGVLAFEEGGEVTRYASRQQASRAAAERRAAEKSAATAVKARPVAVAEVARKLSYKEKKELATLPATIEALETEVAEMEVVMSAPETWQRPRDEVTKLQKDFDALQAKVLEAYARWEELEALSEG